MHTIWKGAISFGLVNIPVKMFAATEEKTIRFRNLHQPCKTPLKYIRTCPHCDRSVTPDEVVKGIEYADGKFVLMEKEELEAIVPEKNKAIEIVDFVDLKEIDPIYFHKTYYLGPGETGERAYALLRAAMEETGRIGVAQLTVRSKKTLAVVRVYEKQLVMETIFYPDEVRPASQVPGVNPDLQVVETELQMAKQLIENLTTPFQPEKYRDTYREKLEEAIAKKISGEEVVEAPEARPEKIVDLMEALKASLEDTGNKKTQSKKSVTAK